MNRKSIAVSFALSMLGFAAPLLAQDADGMTATPAINAELKQLEQKVGVNPFDPVALNNLAAAKAANGDWVAAADLLARAHQLAPDSQTIANNNQLINNWIKDAVKRPRGNAALQATSEMPEPTALWQPGGAAPQGR